MHDTLRRVVDATVSASQLNNEEKEEVRKELMAHMQDYEDELQFQGMTEEDSTQKITESFGSPKKIGEQLHMVHRRFDRIPFIGPLFYYTTAVRSIQLFLSHILMVCVFLAITTIIHYWINERFIVAEVGDRILTYSVILFVIGYSVAQGVWVQKKFKQWMDAFEVVILSHMPFILGYAVYGFNRLFFQNSDLIGWQFFGIVLLIHIGLMLIGMCIHSVYQIFLKRLRK